MKSNIKEAVGVPNFMYGTAKNVFAQILSQLNDNPFDRIIPGETFNIHGPFKIGDVVLDEFRLIINLKVEEGANTPTIKRYSANSQITRSNFTLNYGKYSTDTCFLVIDITLPPRTRLFNRDLADMLTGDSVKSLPIVGHELKHIYDMLKRGSDHVSRRATYVSYNPDTRIGGTYFRSIGRFLYNIYYTTSAEALVRNAEVYTRLRAKKLTKANFQKYIKEDPTYRKLLIISTYSMSDLIQDIKDKDLQEVKEILSRIGFDISTYSTLEDLISEFLKIVYLAIASSNIHAIGSILNVKGHEELSYAEAISQGVSSNFFLTGERFKELQYFYKHKEKLETGDYKQWFKKRFEDINQGAKKSIKKLHKIYSILPDDGTPLAEVTYTMDIGAYFTDDNYKGPGANILLHELVGITKDKDSGKFWITTT